MTSARYLLRFDDICPTMNWQVWEQIEQLLIKYEIKPIVAVVPDNRDKDLIVDQERFDFWDRVRCWNENEWAIGLHGYQHTYETIDPGLMKLNQRSEFSGLSNVKQDEKIALALARFYAEGIQPRIWIAPAHSFDQTTIVVLKKHGIGLISDGFYLRVLHDRGMIWIPQQLWRFRTFPFGMWTVCFHHNFFTQTDLIQLELQIRKYRRQILSLDEVENKNDTPQIDWKDKLFASLWGQLLHLKREMSILRES